MSYINKKNINKVKGAMKKLFSELPDFNSEESLLYSVHALEKIEKYIRYIPELNNYISEEITFISEDIIEKDDENNLLFNKDKIYLNLLKVDNINGKNISQIRKTLNKQNLKSFTVNHNGKEYYIEEDNIFLINKLIKLGKNNFIKDNTFTFYLENGKEITFEKKEENDNIKVFLDKEKKDYKEIPNEEIFYNNNEPFTFITLKEENPTIIKYKEENGKKFFTIKDKKNSIHKFPMKEGEEYRIGKKKYVCENGKLYTYVKKLMKINEKEQLLEPYSGSSNLKKNEILLDLVMNINDYYKVQLTDNRILNIYKKDNKFFYTIDGEDREAEECFYDIRKNNIIISEEENTITELKVKKILHNNNQKVLLYYLFKKYINTGYNKIEEDFKEILSDNQLIREIINSSDKEYIDLLFFKINENKHNLSDVFIEYMKNRNSKEPNYLHNIFDINNSIVNINSDMLHNIYDNFLKIKNTMHSITQFDNYKDFLIKNNTSYENIENKFNILSNKNIYMMNEQNLKSFKKELENFNSYLSDIETKIYIQFSLDNDIREYIGYPEEQNIETENNDMDIPSYSEEQNIDIPSYPENNDMDIPSYSEEQNIDIPSYPENNDMDIPSYPENNDIDIPSYPENNDIDIPSYPENNDMDIPSYPENNDMDIPSYPENNDIDIPNYPENNDIDIPNYPENNDIDIPSYPEEQNVDMYTQYDDKKDIMDEIIQNESYNSIENEIDTSNIDIDIDMDNIDDLTRSEENENIEKIKNKLKEDYINGKISLSSYLNNLKTNKITNKKTHMLKLLI